MLEKVKAYALEKFAGDEKAAADFMDGFQKSAMAGKDTGPFGRAKDIMDRIANSGDIKGEHTLKGSLMTGIGSALGQGLGGAFINTAIAAVGSGIKGVNNGHLHTRFLTALENAISSNRIIKEANKEKVRQYAETIFKFAPNVATDPNLLSSILANAIHGEGIDPMTVKTLTELEGRYTDNTSFSPKTYI